MFKYCKATPRLHLWKRRFLRFKKEANQLKQQHFFIMGLLLILYFLLRNFWLGSVPGKLTKENGVVKILVDEPNCKIVNLEPKNLILMESPDCPFAACKPYTEIKTSPETEAKAYIKRTQEAQICDEVTCCAVAYSMPRRDNEEIRYPIKNCYPVNSSQLIQPTIYTEVLETICTDLCDNRRIVNYHPLIVTTPKVAQKIKAWKKIKKSVVDSITRVVFITIDNLNRNLAAKFLWKTLKTVTRLGFIDMKGYSMVEGSTTGNFLATTLGLNLSRLGHSCSVNTLGIYDGCPFVWKEFRNFDYLTLYLDETRLQSKINQTQKKRLKDGENGPHLINTDFIAQPTDFYIPPYFVRDKMRVNQMDAQLYNSFASTSSQDFILNFAELFQSKYQKYPSISVLRLSPTSPEETAKLDSKLSKFLENVKSKQKNTLVVLSSNIGLKKPGINNFDYKLANEIDLQTDSVTSTPERPFLFVFLPETLKSYKNNLVTNSNRLSTSFDVHRTFQQVLIESCLSLGSSLEECRYISLGENNGTERKRRRAGFSLLQPIERSRGCEGAQIPMALCPCGVEPAFSV